MIRSYIIRKKKNTMTMVVVVVMMMMMKGEVGSDRNYTRSFEAP